MVPQKKPNVNPNVGLSGPTIIMVGSYPQDGQTIWLGDLNSYGEVNGKITSINGVEKEVKISLKNLEDNTTVVSSSVKIDDNNEFFFDFSKYKSDLSVGKYQLNITAYDKYGNENTKSLILTFTDVKLFVSAATNTAIVYFQSIYNKNDYEFTVDGTSYTLTNAGTVDGIILKNLENGMHTVLLNKNNGKTENLTYNFPTPAKLNPNGVFLDNTVNYYYSRNGDSAVIVYFKTFNSISGYYYVVSPSYGDMNAGTLHYVSLKKPGFSGAILFTYPNYKLNVRYYLKIYTVDTQGNLGTVVSPYNASFTHFTLYTQVDSYASLQNSAEYTAASAGSNVTINVNVKNIEKLMAMRVEVTSPLFNSTPTVEVPTLNATLSNKQVMSVISKTATKVDALIGYADEPNKIDEHFTTNGNVLTITWKIPANAKPGVYPMYMSIPKFVNEENEPIDGVHVDQVSYILVK